MAGITKVNIRNPDGTPGFGFLKDGVTYKDEAATQRIDEGTKVSANGKIYTYNGEGKPSSEVNVTQKNLTGLNSSGTTSSASNYSSVTPVTYTINGQVKTGFLKDGRTYTDSTLTTRVPTGSQVHTAGGEYIMTGNGGMPSWSTITNNYGLFSDEANDIYKGAQKAQQQRIDANVQAMVNRLNYQKNDVEEEREEAARKAYAAYRTAVNPYGARAQQLASLGLADSGFSETSLASLGNQYQQAISDAELARNKAIRAIELQIEEARLSGDAQKAESLATYAQNLANMRLQNAQFYANLMLQMANSAYAMDNAAAESAYNQTQDKKNEYMAWIQLGVVPSDAAAVLGMPQAELDALAMYYKAQRIGSGNGGGGNVYSGGNNMPTGGFNG